MKKSDVEFEKITDIVAKQTEEEIGTLDRLRKKKISDYITKGKVLDVGCFSAGLLTYLNKDIEYYGIDISEQRVKDSLKMTSNIVQQDVMDGIPFPNKMFDYVVLGEIIEHVENPIYLLRECRRVLKPKGKLIITTPNARSFINIMASILNCSQYSHPLHLHTFSKYELENVLRITGFKPKKMETIYFRLIPKTKINFELMLKLFPQLGKILVCIAEPTSIKIEEITDMVH